MNAVLHHEARLEPLSPRERGRGEGPGPRDVPRFRKPAAISRTEPSSGAARHLLPRGEGKSLEPVLETGARK